MSRVRVPYYKDNTVRHNLVREFMEADMNKSAKRKVAKLATSPEEHRDNLLYLWRFVYQKTYKIPTLEEALKRDDLARESPLRYMTLNYPRGAMEYDRDTEPHGIYLRGLNSDIIISDIKIILTIIYNKYDLEDPNDYLKVLALVKKGKNKKGKCTLTSAKRLEAA